MDVIGLLLVGGAMFGLGALTCLWITFGAVWVKAEPTYWTTTAQPTTAPRTAPGTGPLGLHRHPTKGE